MYISLCKKSSEGMGEYVCLSSSTKFPVGSYLCVYVMKALLNVLNALSALVDLLRDFGL